MMAVRPLTFFFVYSLANIVGCSTTGPDICSNDNADLTQFNLSKMYSELIDIVIDNISAAFRGYVRQFQLVGNNHVIIILVTSIR